MAKKVYERLSQRAYAERLGISNTHVSQAVKLKIIKKGWDVQAKMIIVEEADKEWGDAVRKIPKTASIQQIIPEQNNEGVRAKLKIDAGAPLAEARRIKEIAAAQLNLYALSEKAGTLIDKVQVQKTLQAYGMEMKKAFEQIPERHIDAIRAAGNRNDALNILAEAIHDVLIRLTEITNNGLDK